MIKKKLIEVALPLDAINKASAREKSIRHGHPSTLHLWWARRPLAAARAVIFAQMVDDPSTYVDVLRSDAKRRRKAESVLKARKKIWDEAKQTYDLASQSNIAAPDPGPEPTLNEILAELERERLFKIIEDLVLWENTTNEKVLQRAREEIWQSWRRTCAENADHPRAKELFDRHKLPAFHDSTRVGRDASRIAEEVIVHLEGLVGANVKVTMEIEVEIPDGAPDHVVRTVTENSQALKFISHGFENE